MFQRKMLNRYGLVGRLVYERCLVGDREFRKKLGVEENLEESQRMCDGYVRSFLRGYNGVKRKDNEEYNEKS